MSEAENERYQLTLSLQKYIALKIEQEFPTLPQRNYPVFIYYDPKSDKARCNPEQLEQFLRQAYAYIIGVHEELQDVASSGNVIFAVLRRVPHFIGNVKSIVKEVRFHAKARQFIDDYFDNPDSEKNIRKKLRQLKNRIELQSQSCSEDACERLIDQLFEQFFGDLNELLKYR